MEILKMGGLTKGIVVNTNDPAGFGRVKVRIPELHGLVKEESYGAGALGKTIADRSRVQDSALPWCEVCHPYGSDNLPEVNQVVLIGFIDGTSNQPVVLGWLGYDYTDNEDVCEVQSIYQANPR